MKKVLVTGATGFIGNYVVGELLHKGYEVIASSANPGKAKSMHWYEKVTYKPFDLTRFPENENLYSFFNEPDLMIHLAWEGLPNYQQDFHLNENFPRHSALLCNLMENGLRDLTVTGTCLEYGLQEGMLSEDMTAKPSNAYAVAKDRLRQFLTDLEASYPFMLKWVRLFYMYGTGQGPNSLLSQLQAAIERGDASFNMSPGDQLRDYLPVQEVARYLVGIAGQQDVDGIINCCSGKPVAVKELVGKYLSEKGAHMKLNAGYYPYSIIEPRNFWGNNSKLKTITGDE